MEALQHDSRMMWWCKKKTYSRQIECQCPSSSAIICFLFCYCSCHCCCWNSCWIWVSGANAPPKEKRPRRNKATTVNCKNPVYGRSEISLVTLHNSFEFGLIALHACCLHGSVFYCSNFSYYYFSEVFDLFLQLHESC